MWLSSINTVLDVPWSNTTKGNTFYVETLVPPHERCCSVPRAVKKLITACYRSTNVGQETPYTLGHRLWSLLPFRKILAAHNIASDEKRYIFRSGKVHRRYNNAESTLCTTRRKFVDSWVRNARHLKRWGIAALPGRWLNVAHTWVGRF